MLQLNCYIDGKWVLGQASADYRDKYTGEKVGEIALPSREQVTASTRALAIAQARSGHSPHARYQILARASDLVKERADELVEAIITDAGFTRIDAVREVQRAAETLLLCGEEAKRLTGETVPVDADPGAPARIAFTLRRPIGVVCCITPFNSPLNTVCHKVGPALAAGNAVVLKPAVQTPWSSDLLVRLLLDAGLPEGLIALVHGDGRTTGQWLLEDEAPGFYAFTGSTAIGRHIQQTIGVRRSQMELGSLASTIVCADTDLDRAATLCVNAGFRKAGQVCTSVQRLYVHDSVVADFTTILGEVLADKVVGDPRRPDTFVGPVIDAASADRISSWITEAADLGATVEQGGTREGTLVAPTLLSGVSAKMRVMNTEIFGPVVSLRPFTDLDEAVAEVNDTPYGLASGIFTNDIGNALKVAQNLRVGTVHINETSSSRVDLMPFGGVKQSGFGKEGPFYAIREMSEETLITMGVG